MQDQPAQSVNPVVQNNPVSAQSYVDAYVPPSQPITTVPPTPPTPLVPTVASTPISSAPKISPVPPVNPIIQSRPLGLDDASKKDPQSALDELTKMFDEPAKPAPADLNKPNMPANPGLPPMNKPVVSPPVGEMAQPPKLPTNPQPSEDLLAEIESALSNKKDQPPLDSSPMTTLPTVPQSQPPVFQRTPNIAPPAPAAKTPNLPVAAGLESEKLEDQNIFYLLGVDSSTAEQKEQFLDELQQVIWEDFVDHDVELLLTEKEYAELKTKYQLDGKKPLTEQEEVIAYLENLIPDLENLMLEKAIRLKADLVKERIMGLREKLVGQEAKLTELGKVEGLIAQEKWLTAAKALNQFGS